MTTINEMNMTSQNPCERDEEHWHVSLKVLMNRHGTDKLFRHHYDEEYQWHFEPLRNLQLNLLEIGVGGYTSRKSGGESLKVWRDYFFNATIHGLDVYEKRLSLGDRVTVWQGDQNDPKFLVGLVKKTGIPDIIIDDGSHRQEHIFTSFTTLFPLLKSGGIYVIEDLATAYDPEYGGDQGAPPTIGLIQRLVDGIHWQLWKGRGPRPIDQMVKSVHVSKELAFIYKH